MPVYHEDDPLFIANPHVVRKLGQIEQTLTRIADSLEYVAPMARWFFENADLIFKPKEDSNAQT